VLDTCLTKDDVYIAIKRYNKYHGSGMHIQFVQGREGAALLELRDRLGTALGDEYKWLSMPFLSREDEPELKGAFRPVMPESWTKNDREWLSNLDIDDVMRQYETTIPDFAFVGVFPMDFNHKLSGGKCVSTEMCNFNVADMWHAGKHRIGIVMNTDKHNEGGSHWVCCYIGIDPRPHNKIYGMIYYDSVAAAPPKEVVQLMEDIQRQVSLLHGASLAWPFKCEHNDIRRQYKGTECGVFVMFFLICCASGRLNFKHICQSMGRDDDLHTLRKIFFTPLPTYTDTDAKQS